MGETGDNMTSHREDNMKNNTGNIIHMHDTLNEKIRKVKLRAIPLMVDMGLTEHDAYFYLLSELEERPPKKKSGFYVNKTKSEITVEEKEAIRICYLLIIRNEIDVINPKDGGKKQNKHSDPLVTLGKGKCYVILRRDLGSAIWILNDASEYNRLHDLEDSAYCYSKLMSQYGVGLPKMWITKTVPRCR